MNWSAPPDEYPVLVHFPRSGRVGVGTGRSWRAACALGIGKPPTGYREPPENNATPVPPAGIADGAIGFRCEADTCSATRRKLPNDRGNFDGVARLARVRYHLSSCDPRRLPYGGSDR
jgi:hypothetical protein